MELEMQVYQYYPCHLEIFTINGKKANEGDFGYSRDTNLNNAPAYGCGCKEFIIDASLAEGAMLKYNLTCAEYEEICDKLKSMLYVGRCEWCV